MTVRTLLRGVKPCCSPARHELFPAPQTKKKAETADDAAQRRFEQICARELLGDTD